MAELNPSVEKFLKGTPELNSKKEYWFVRTDSGSYYDTFKDNSFIALGWNNITVEDIKKSLNDPEPLKKQIQEFSASNERKWAEKENRKVNQENIIDLSTKGGKQKVSMIINKLQHFYSLKLGDIIVIPNYGSSKFSFGFVTDNGIYVDNKNSDECEYRKRRKVEWVIHKQFDELDTIFFTLKKSMHAISSVKTDLAEHIDRVMNDVYFKDGFGHYVIRVKKKEDIKAEDLFELGKDLMALLNIINTHNNYGESIAETIVKINVQSDGDFLLKGPIGNSIVTLALAIALVSCNKNHDHIIPKTPQTTQIVDSLRQRITNLEVEVKTRNN